MNYMVIIDLLLIALICVVIVDLSGFVDSVKSGIKWLITKGKMNSSDYRLKPFDCSLCMTFWTGLIFLLATGNFTLTYLAVLVVISLFCTILKSSILLVEDIFKTIIKLIYKLIDKV